jgi:hypothetical protein
MAFHLRFMRISWATPYPGNERSIYMLSKSKSLVILILIFVVATCIVVFSAGAQKNSNKSGNVTVTGCLQKGDEADEFSLSGDDGKLYDLRSSSVKLADHVGHKVTVSGKFKAETSEKDEDEANESKEGGKKEAGDIQVSSLKMVSSSCQ